MLEKLHSESKMAIGDSMKLLCEALPHLGRAQLDGKLTEIIKILILIVGQRQNDQNSQKEVFDTLRALAVSYRNHPDKADSGLDYIFELMGEYLSQSFKHIIYSTAVIKFVL